MRQWSLWCASVTESDLFCRVELRLLPAPVGTEIDQIAFHEIGGKPFLLFNGMGVLTPGDVKMPGVPSSLPKGFGAGVNPSSLFEMGEYSNVDFEAVMLFELAD